MTGPEEPARRLYAVPFRPDRAQAWAWDGGSLPPDQARSELASIARNGACSRCRRPIGVASPVLVRVNAGEEARLCVACGEHVVAALSGADDPAVQ